jgi:hypothetical protein
MKSSRTSGCTSRATVCGKDLHVDFEARVVRLDRTRRGTTRGGRSRSPTRSILEARSRSQPESQTLDFSRRYLEAPPGFEPGMEVLQTSALPLGDGAGRKRYWCTGVRPRCEGRGQQRAMGPDVVRIGRAKSGAGNGIRTRDFDLGKVALYH